MFKNNNLKLNGITTSAAVVDPAPVWSSFDLLGAGSTTIFTRNSPAADTDPTHIATEVYRAETPTPTSNNTAASAQRQDKVA